MKTYVLQGEAYDDGIVFGAFSNLEDAMKLIPLYKEIGHSCFVTECEIDCLNNTSIKKFRTFHYYANRKLITTYLSESLMSAGDFYIINNDGSDYFKIKSALPAQETLQKIKEELPSVNDDIELECFINGDHIISTIGKSFVELFDRREK